MAHDERRTLAVLGASSDQAFLIRTARELGFRVLAFDQNPYADGFALADERALISTFDVPAITARLDAERARGRTVAGVTTMGSDIPQIVSAVARHLGTSGPSAETARLATDKFAMKERFREAGIPIPWYAEVASADELSAIVHERGGSFVVKPVDRSGSRGVNLVDADCDLAKHFEEARATSFSGRVQVEEFLEGLQISTETIVIDGQAFTPGFADRNYGLLELFRPRIMENGGWVPSCLDHHTRARVARVAEEAALALGIHDGPAKGDLVLTADGPKVIEIAARLSGGDFCESLVPLGTGVNYVRAVIQLATGDPVDRAELEPRFEIAVANRYFFPPAGTLRAIEGTESVRSQEWLEKLEFWYRPGDDVPDCTSHAARFGVFVVTAPDRATCQERVDWVYETIRIVVE